MNMTLLNNILLLIASAFIFFMVREISRIIKIRLELFEEYKKDLEEYKKSLQEYINFIDTVQNDLKDLKNICNHIKQTYNDR